MPQVSLSPDAWTLVVPPGGNSVKSVNMRFGKAWVCFRQPEYGIDKPAGGPPYTFDRDGVWVMALEGAGSDQQTLPGPAGLYARSVRGLAIMYVSD